MPAKIEDLRLRADVRSADDRKLGTLSRLVFDRATQRLTHVVVDTGILRSGEPLWKGGWGIDHDKVVPIGAVADATSDAVTLTMSAEEFRDLAVEFSDEYFVPFPDSEPGRIDLSDLARFAQSLPGQPGPYAMEQATVVSPDEAEIAKDAPVWRLDPHEKVGKVERVLFNENSRRITGLVVSVPGNVLPHPVVLPIDQVVEFAAGVVRITLSRAQVEALAEYTPED
jgi:sporulation protein YlmC with PRC-barrel domain